MKIDKIDTIIKTFEVDPNKDLCFICEPPVERTNCKGHDIRYNGENRFKNDPKFYNGLNYEFGDE